MTKRFLLGIVTFSLLVACNNQNSEKATAITSSEFANIAESLIDQNVSIEGTVMHVCKHSGKKLFINEDRVKVIASEKIASFDVALEGSTVIIKGIVREEAVPVLSSEKEVTDTIKVDNADKKEEASTDCDMEKVKPIYVIEVVEISEVPESSDEAK